MAEKGWQRRFDDPIPRFPMAASFEPLPTPGNI